MYVPYCGLAVVEELAGFSSGVVDPFARDVGPAAWTELQPHQRVWVVPGLTGPLQDGVAHSVAETNTKTILG
jgi:hypothetical protein